MARPLRIEYEGACYHVLSRGDRRENIFRDDTDRERFLETLAAACAKSGWQVHAYCLMNNHFHLIVETPRPNLSAGMKWLLGTFTMRFNRRHKLVGHLFAGRYKSLLIDEQSPAYLKAVGDYVHLNPVRAALVGSEQKLESYVWSSYGSYLRPPRKRPAWLRVDRLLGEHGIGEDDPRGRLEFSRRVETLRTMERQSTPEEQLAMVALRRGWRLGAEDFLARLVVRLEGSAKPVKHRPGSGPERRENEQQRGERLVASMLAERGWSEKRLRAERKGHPVKVAMAKQLRAQTTLTQQQIAGRLRMGSRSYLNNLLLQPSLLKR